MNTISVLIADDDTRMRKVVETIVTEVFPSVVVVAKTNSAAETVDALRRLKPQIAILDIHLIGGTAIEVVKNTRELDYKVIFMSSYREYALEDIRFASIDFVHKPLDVNELVLAVDQVISILLEEGYGKKIQTFVNNTKREGEDKQIVLKSVDKITPVAISDIVCGESLFGTSCFYFTYHKKIETCDPLRRYEAMLQSYMFYRCHTRYVVNLRHVVEVDELAQVVLMSNGMAVPTDARRFKGLRKRLGMLMEGDVAVKEYCKVLR